MATSLEQIIHQYIQLPSRPTGSGWYPVICKVCNDHGHKGPRAGFRFDGTKVTYHCFNCGHSTSFDDNENKRVSGKMVTVLQAFGVPEEQWGQLNLLAMDHDKKKQEVSEKQKNLEPKEIPLPKTFYKLSSADPSDKWAEVAKLTLEDRQCDPSSYPFMLSVKTGNEILDRWYRRLIIPIYKDNKLIYYQGRGMNNQSKKYINPSVSRNNIIYGFDKLFVNPHQPLYIVEGWFDAFVIDGIAIFGNKITTEQKIWLDKSPRKKVYIPDRLGNGALGAKQALKFGWSISTPDIGDCKDVNDAVVKYGKLYVMKTITENTASGFQGEANIGLYCK